jgi:polysaccharide chain length determinant protein (PEP-CTERM system associated)
MADLDRPDWQFTFDTLRRRRRLLLWTGLTTLVVIEAFVLGLPNLYRAQATLLVQNHGEEGASGSSPGEINNRLQAIKQEAMSRGTLTQLVERFNLYGADRPGTATQGHLDAMRDDVRVEIVSGDTNPSGQTTTVAFRVSYVARHPATAADVANTIAAFYVSKNESLREQQVSRATQSLAQQLEETRREIQTQQDRVRAYTSRNIGALPQQLESNMAAVMRLDNNLRVNSTEQMRLLERRQSLLNQIAEIDTRTPPPDDTNPSSVLARLQSELVELRTRLSDQHPDVRAKRAEIQQMESQIKQGVARRAGTPDIGASPRAAAHQALQEVEGQLERIEKDNAGLRAQIAAYENRVNNAPAHETVFAGMVRDLQATRERYDALLRRHDEAQMNERAQTVGEGQEFTVLDAAIPPAMPTGPARLLLMAVGALFAIVTGVAAAAVADRRDTSFHSLDELRAFTRVPVLASIPEIITREGRLARRARSAAVAGATLAVLAVLASGAFYVAHQSDQIARVLSRVI